MLHMKIKENANALLFFLISYLLCVSFFTIPYLITDHEEFHELF